MAANRAKAKVANEEKKRKEAAETLKKEVEAINEEAKSAIVNAASKAPAKNNKPAKNTPQTPTRTYVKEPSAKGVPAQGVAPKAPAASTPKAPAGVNAAKGPTTNTSGISGARPGVASQAKPQERTMEFERKPGAAMPKAPAQGAPKAPAQKPGAKAPGNTAGNQSITGAGVKTRVWVRDDN